MSVSDRPENFSTVHRDALRDEIGADLAHTVLEAAARRLAEAIADYDAALDDLLPLHELQILDHMVGAAQNALAAAQDADRAAVDGAPVAGTPAEL